ncbi:anthocyanidin 3-O-glucosyltransferase 7-like [Telopea speciosissima]|uniref:anthocyanidin 3-O-glucosyltransferase 7-like n=1 Tax=Telopea speciosissima TaxID=54955 RepID=UPI001CC43B77|nr:anthocyanidin 3-O-glucosyltransferase 7-like [Telopea speciosissima]
MAQTAQDAILKKPHVAFLSFPFASHPMSLITFARRIAAAAPQITCSFFGTVKSNGTIFASIGDDDEGLQNLKAYDIDNGISENYVFKGKLLEEIELFMKAAPTNFRKGMEVAEEKEKKKITCVLSDPFLWFAGELAEEMGVPWVAAFSGGPFSLTTHLYTDLIRSTIGVAPNGKEDETLDFVPGLSALRVRDLVDGLVSGNLESIFARILDQMGQLLPRATAVCINSFEELDATIIDTLKLKLQRCLPIALFNPESNLDKNGCLPWLEKQKPASVAYISFGTSASLPPHELVALAQGLEASRTPFLWSLKDTSQLPKEFIDKISKHEINGLIVPWTPQFCVLQHRAVGVFLTHCGWNSVLESLITGKPMICRPFMADQWTNSRIISHLWGIGLQLDNGVFTRDGIIKALDLVLFKEGRKMREIGEALKELCKIGMGPNGSCTRNFNSLLQLLSTT